MHFLVGLDRDPAAMDILRFALRLASPMNADVTVAHAVDPGVTELLDSEPITTLEDARGRLIIERLGAYEERAVELLERAEIVAAELVQPIDTEVLYGNPVPELTTYAVDIEADIIVVGHRGRSERIDQLVGSVARGVVERSSVPVLVVR